MASCRCCNGNLRSFEAIYQAELRLIAGADGHAAASPMVARCAPPAVPMVTLTHNWAVPTGFLAAAIVIAGFIVGWWQASLGAGTALAAAALFVPILSGVALEILRRRRSREALDWAWRQYREDHAKWQRSWLCEQCGHVEVADAAPSAGRCPPAAACRSGEASPRPQNRMAWHALLRTAHRGGH